MTRLPRVTGKEVLAALGRAGFVVVRVRDSHHYLRPAAGGPLVCVPVHSGEVLKTAALKTILDQAELSVEVFRELL